MPFIKSYTPAKQVGRAALMHGIGELEEPDKEQRNHKRLLCGTNALHANGDICVAAQRSYSNGDILIEQREGERGHDAKGSDVTTTTNSK